MPFRRAYVSRRFCEYGFFIFGNRVKERRQTSTKCVGFCIYTCWLVDGRGMAGDETVVMDDPEEL